MPGFGEDRNRIGRHSVAHGNGNDEIRVRQAFENLRGREAGVDTQAKMPPSIGVRPEHIADRDR